MKSHVHLKKISNSKLILTTLKEVQQCWKVMVATAVSLGPLIFQSNSYQLLARKSGIAGYHDAVAFYNVKSG